MADDERVMDPATQRLFDAAGIISTPETRQAARNKLAQARARMTPEKWAALRTEYGLTTPS